MLAGPVALSAQPGGGGPIAHQPPDGCISPVERTLAANLLEAYEKTYGQISRPEPGKPPPPLTFYPLGGRLWHDVFTYNYVDLQPSTSLLDFDCLQYTYDGHRGNDTLIRSFEEQALGVPVFAAQDGVVVALHDGEPDMNTWFGGQPSNFVIIDHGLGRQGWYFHLKTNSIVVAIDELVWAGQMIAMCGSSGNSTGPHLHFEVIDGEAVFEPYSGSCRPGKSGWYQQPQPIRAVYLQDFGITHESLAGHPGWPVRWPADGQIALSDPLVRVWFYGTNLPAGSTWTVRFKRPNGSLVPGAVPQSFNNAFWRWFSWWWSYDVPEMHSITGTWHVLVYINEVLMVEAPLEVRTERTADFNRPPEEIELAFDPPSPLTGFPLACIVKTSRTLDDPDFDLVRYQYEWTVEGAVVRSITTAGQTDVLSANHFQKDDLIGCTVAPSDGELLGPGDTIVRRAGQPPVPAVSATGVCALTLGIIVAAVVLIRRRLET